MGKISDNGGKKSVSKTDGNRELKKREYLKEVDKFALTNAIYHIKAKLHRKFIYR